MFTSLMAKISFPLSLRLRTKRGMKKYLKKINYEKNVDKCMDM